MEIDLAHPLTTAGEELYHLDHDLSDLDNLNHDLPDLDHDLSDLSEVCNGWPKK